MRLSKRPRPFPVDTSPRPFTARTGALPAAPKTPAPAKLTLPKPQKRMPVDPIAARSTAPIRKGLLSGKARAKK